MKSRIALALVVLIGILALNVGCQSAYYGAMEKFGVHKRDILVDRVEEAKEAQEEAKEQFTSAFDEFLAATGAEVGSLKQTFKSLKGQLDDSEKKAVAVRDKIESIRRVSNALFREWEGELEQYSSEELRLASESQLRLTQQLYEKLAFSMNKAAARMDPVLDAFRDQTLFLKHNLNAQAIAALNKTTIGLQDEVQALIEQMETSISEANEFIDKMRSGS